MDLQPGSFSKSSNRYHDRNVFDPSVDAEAAVSVVIAKWADALHTKNTDAVLSLLSPELVQFLLAAPLRNTGSTAMGRAGIQEWFDSFQGTIGYEIRDLSITASEDIAFAHSLNHVIGNKTDGTKQDMWMRDTLCFKKIEGEWKITHQHESVPFYMDSHEVADDLKPERLNTEL